MQIEQLSFIEPIVIIRGLEFDNQELINSLDGLKAYNNRSGLQLKSLTDSNNSEVIKLFDKVKALGLQYCKNNGTGHTEVNIIECWANEINEEVSWMKNHIHTASFISCIYYPLAEEGSSIVRFERSNWPTLCYIYEKFQPKQCFMAAQFYEVQPEPGMLIIFPSWLQHHVKPNVGKKRLSFAFNLSASRDVPDSEQPFYKSLFKKDQDENNPH